MHLFFEPDFAIHQSLTEEEAFHATKVLRLKVGDEIKITDGKGYFYEGIFKEIHQKRCSIQVNQKAYIEPRPFSIEIVIAPTKNLDRMEWLVEKATEIGVDKISFVYTQRSERRVIKLDRLHKIAISAMKQSLQAYLPVILEVGDFKKYIPTIKSKQKFIAHLPESETPKHLIHSALPNTSYTVLIGPEGDFTDDELKLAIEHSFEMVVLGKTRLRTETAALVACQALHFINQ